MRIARFVAPESAGLGTDPLFGDEAGRIKGKIHFGCFQPGNLQCLLLHLRHQGFAPGLVTLVEEQQEREAHQKGEENLDTFTEAHE